MRGDGRPSALTHTPQFFRDVSRMVHEYLESRPDPATYDFLALNFDALTKKHGGVTGLAFRSYPSFPQRFRERLHDQPRTPRAAHVVPLKSATRQRTYTEADLEVRQFLPHSTRRLAPASAATIVRGIHPKQAQSQAAQRAARGASGDSRH